MKRFMYILGGGNSWIVQDRLRGLDVCSVDDSKYADVICNALNAAAEAKEIA